jgi:transposase-like protein
MTTTSAVVGYRTRYDVKTKCQIVKLVLERNYNSKAELKAYLSDLATSLHVNPVTIKLWITKYEKTYPYGLDLPDGVMSYSFLTIDDTRLPTVLRKLSQIRAQLAAVCIDHEASTIPVPSEEIRSYRRSMSILDELLT